MTAHTSQLRTVAQQLNAEHTLGDVQHLLQEAGIDVLVLKGPHLGYTVYRRPSDRPYGDLDLLVRPCQFEAAKQVLLANRYRRFRAVPRRLATTRVHYNAQLVSPRGVLIELHRYFSSMNRYPVDTELLFERAKSFRIGRWTARGLSPEHLLVHLIIHMIKSYFRVQEKHYRDIAVVLEKCSINWDEVIATLRGAGARRGAYYVLRLTQACMGTAAPRDVLDRLRPGVLWRTWLGHVLTRRPVSYKANHLEFLDQIVLGLPLLDYPTQWPRYLLRYVALRIADVWCTGQ